MRPHACESPQLRAEEELLTPACVWVAGWLGLGDTRGVGTPHDSNEGQPCCALLPRWSWRSRCLVVGFVSTATPRGATGGCLARTQDSTCTGRTRESEDKARRRQGCLECRRICEIGHLA